MILNVDFVSNKILLSSILFETKSFILSSEQISKTLFMYYSFIYAIKYEYINLFFFDTT